MDEEQKKRFHQFVEGLADVDTTDKRFAIHTFETEYARHVEVVYAAGRVWVTITNTYTGQAIALRLTPDQARDMALMMLPPAD